MALGTVTALFTTGGAPSAPSFADFVSFPGESSYTSGGPTGFAAKFHTLLKQNRTILGVITTRADKYRVEYDITLDKLFIRDLASGLEASGDLSAITFEVCVISK